MSDHADATAQEQRGTKTGAHAVDVDSRPSRARTVSVMLGLMIGPDGQPRRAYRALRDLTCARCSALIPEGTIFGRRSGLMNVPQSFPYCQTCLPLRSLADAVQSPSPSIETEQQPQRGEERDR